MDLPSLLLACSVHADDRLLEAIVYVHGRGNPYAITHVGSAASRNQDEEPTLTPSSAKAAREIVLETLAAGGEPVIGLLPARPGWAEEFAKTVGDLFDPCTNVAVASAKISEFDHGCRARGRAASSKARRACTLARYGSSLGLPALRQVVMADLTLPSAFEVESSVVSPVLATLPFPETGAGLFFQLAPASPALPLSKQPPSLLPRQLGEWAP